MKWRRQEGEDDLPEEPLINLTPLIDVVFVVLIAFILIAPVLDIDRVDLAASGGEKKKEAPSPEQSPLTIVVRADNSIWMQGKRFSPEELEKTLVAQKKLYPQKTPQVIHDKSASFGTYQTVKNTLERCGFEEMDILLKPN
ncbi:MAG TPA: biopolymer transporter ExbD [Chlamydiales bacterium]|jgi:biopolymer transport protein ExbD